jgi:hypothetical protein
MKQGFYKESQNLYSSRKVIKMIVLRRMGWWGMWKQEMPATFWPENLKGLHHFGGISVYRRIILKWRKRM